MPYAIIVGTENPDCTVSRARWIASRATLGSAIRYADDRFYVEPSKLWWVTFYEFGKEPSLDIDAKGYAYSISKAQAI